MLVSGEDCMEMLRCPRSKSALRREDSHTLISQSADGGSPRRYPIVNGVPILVDFEHSVLSEKETIERIGGSVIERKKYRYFSKVVKRLLSPAKKATRKNVDALIQTLMRLPEPPRVLVIGGGSVGQGMGPLYEHPSIMLYNFDLYASPYVQFIADAHQIPLPDEGFDAVVIQAVLEHTLQPCDVVEEIWRVLKPDGLVYAETPFMQQVHEGAYDFTRFSESGHRYLFRRFEAISTGVSGGPGIQFMWSVDYLARSVFRSRSAGKLAKLAFFWTQYLDNLIPEEYAVDGASGVYFYGRKAQQVVSPSDIIAHYKGAQ